MAKCNQGVQYQPLMAKFASQIAAFRTTRLTLEEELASTRAAWRAADGALGYATKDRENGGSRENENAVLQRVVDLGRHMGRLKADISHVESCLSAFELAIAIIDDVAVACSDVSFLREA